ncbi:muskelin-like [Amphibalanus amphitrite]|uniref:muskelin-like n=1 Tax=Amphibalanus amphitrite TaxID=1232801 RepID=UPI001C902100|nr:muskelin-like [Amphibalanus amphitrite]XP_043224159.1 muskelin-like [Amphibalanus amphitrite]
MDQTVKLTYSIHDYSSFSGSYLPKNIAEDKPNDQASRWSSENNNPPQYITLKLKQPAIVRTITFGKYEKTHVCNLKKFKVYGGLCEDNLIELLDSGLKNDNQPETFYLRYKLENNPFPCQYIKVVPLHSWGPSFNYSIWYVELWGVDDHDTVLPHMNWFNAYREKEAIRLCLKHFRQHNYGEAFSSLQKRTRVQLEAPLLTELFESLVERGDFAATEEAVQRAQESGLFSEYINQHEYRPEWRPIVPEPGAERPGMRGGHQMCFDPTHEVMYLFGGWDGTQDLSDLWAFYIRQGQWTRLSADTSTEGGPTARSCHKMCLDVERQQLFTLGRYVDSAQRIPENLKGDFYMYDIPCGRWTLITDDTASMGGPALIFDHQMCLDPVSRTLYVFGGRELTCTAPSSLDDRTGTLSSVDPVFSGLYAYHVATSTWTRLRADSYHPGPGTIRSRVSHCMLFDQKSRKLYILAGQRSKEYLNDFFTYSPDTDELTMISDGTRGDGSVDVPAAGTTQRATIDVQQAEIHVLSGLSKDKEKKEDNLKNSFWVYDIKQNRWSCIYRNRAEPSGSDDSKPLVEPCPRFAHQLVFDHMRKIFYLFGGNPGRKGNPKMRLDDFWRLKLTRPTCSEVLRQCRLLLRKQRFEELVPSDPVAALQYLQTEVAAAVDHADAEQERQFQLLAGRLFAPPAADPADPEPRRAARSRLFDQLTVFFPAEMAQPRSNLTDLIRLDK